MKTNELNVSSIVKTVTTVFDVCIVAEATINQAIAMINSKEIPASNKVDEMIGYVKEVAADIDGLKKKWNHIKVTKFNQSIAAVITKLEDKKFQFGVKWGNESQTLSKLFKTEAERNAMIEKINANINITHFASFEN